MIKKFSQENIAICDECGEAYEFTSEEDLEFVEYGIAVLKTRCTCGNQVCAENYQRPLTKKNFSYPANFADYNKDIETTDKEIEEIIYHKMEDFEHYSEEKEIQFIQTGNKIILLQKENDQVFVLVGSDVKETYLDIEKNI